MFRNGCSNVAVLLNLSVGTMRLTDSSNLKWRQELQENVHDQSINQSECSVHI